MTSKFNLTDRLGFKSNLYLVVDLCIFILVQSVSNWPFSVNFWPFLANLVQSFVFWPNQKVINNLNAFKNGQEFSFFCSFQNQIQIRRENPLMVCFKTCPRFTENNHNFFFAFVHVCKLIRIRRTKMSEVIRRKESGLQTRMTHKEIVRNVGDFFGNYVPKQNHRFRQWEFDWY